MIHTLRLQNFKGIRDVEIGLERLTVLVGPNGSGKTSFLQGLNFFTEVAFQRHTSGINEDIFLNGYRSWLPSEIPMIFTGSTEYGDLRLTMMSSYEEYMANLNRIEQMDVDILKIEGREAQAANHWSSLPNFPAWTASSDYAKFFRFEVAQMDDSDSRLGESVASNGNNLPGFLLHLQISYPEVLELVNEKLRSVIPSITRVRFDMDRFDNDVDRFTSQTQPEPQTISTALEDIIFDLANGSVITGRAASEGTLLILALIAVLTDPNQVRPNIILVDDLDRGLHPLAQRDVIALLRKVLEQQPDLQIVATTHSPYLVNSLRAEEVRMTTLREDGTVACGRLVDHPDFARWKDDMFPGELWTLFGEKWVADIPHEVVQ